MWRMRDRVLCVFILWQSLCVMADNCGWKISITKLLNLTQSVSQIEYPLSVVDVTEVVSQLDSVVLRQLSKFQTRYFAYPYNILLEVECLINSEVDSTTIAKSILMQGRQPYLNICWQSKHAHSTGSICKLAKSAVIDLAKYKGNGRCLEEICQPAWILPFICDAKSHVFTLEVYGMDNFLQSTKMTFNVHGYSWLNTTTQVKIINHNRTLFTDIHFVPGNCFVKIYGPLKSQQSVYITQDDSNKVMLLQLPDVAVSSQTSLCSCLKEPHIMGTATLKDRMLILTQAGLFELHEEFQSNRSSYSNIKRSSLPAGKCVRDMTVPVHSSEIQQQQLLLIGDCNDKISVFAANIEKYPGQPLNFSILEDVDGLGPCESTSSSCVQDCRVITCTPSALNHGTVFCLLSTPLHYKFIMFTDKSWKLISLIPLSMVIPSYTDKHIPITTADASNGSLQTIILDRIITSITVTNHIYILGSHVLHSYDGGRNFFFMPWSFSGSVVLTAVSISGYIVFVTGQQEIWTTQLGSTEAVQIYPSLAWEAVNSRLGMLQTHSQLHIITIFFDINDDLQLLLLEHSKINKHKVPLVDILQTTAIQQSAVTGSTFHLSSQCLVSDVSFITVPQIQFTRNKVYRFGPPFPEPQELFHDLKSILVYHILIQSLEIFESNTNKQLLSVHGKYLAGYQNVAYNWRSILNVLLINEAFILENGLMDNDVFIDLNQFERVYEVPAPSVHNLPHVIYLSINQNFTFKMLISLNSKMAAFDQLVVSSVSSNPNVLLISSEREEFTSNDTVKYEVTVRDRGQLSEQNLPGINLLHTSVTLSLSTTTLKCFQKKDKIVPQGQYIIDVHIGCPPDQYVLFDWNATKKKVKQTVSDDWLYDGLQQDPGQSFYFSHTFYPYFNIYDDATGQLLRFKGNYTLKIIGGKHEDDDNVQIFSEEEVAKYNKLDRDNQYQIWSPAAADQPLYDGWPVYTEKTNSILWLCQSKSVCANILPVFPKSPEFYFLMEFSNRFVDNNSYCDYTKTFLVHIHGLPINDTYVSTSILATCLSLLVLHIAVYYLLNTQTRNMKQRLASVASHFRRIHSSRGNDKRNRPQITIIVTPATDTDTTPDNLSTSTTEL